MIAHARDSVDDRTLMECRICWHVYNPEQGDELGQIAPGTPFRDLPADWRCPDCDGARELYLACD